jgi:hypothetical protein
VTSSIVASLLVSLSLIAGGACNRGNPEIGDRDRDQGRVNQVIDRLLGPKTEIVQLPAGTRIAFATDTTLSSQLSKSGERFTGTLQQDVLHDGRTALPAGSEVLGVVTSVQPLKAVGGRAILEFEVNQLVTPSGQEVPVLARFARAGKSETAKDSATIAAGAIVGAVVGHQVEGDPEGRAIGGLVGAGIGTAIAADTKGETIVLPAGTIFELTLLEAAGVQIET